MAKKRIKLDLVLFGILVFIYFIVEIITFLLAGNKGNNIIIFYVGLGYVCLLVIIICPDVIKQSIYLKDLLNNYSKYNSFETVLSPPITSK